MLTRLDFSFFLPRFNCSRFFQSITPNGNTLLTPMSIDESTDSHPLKKARSSSFIPEGAASLAAPSPPPLSPTLALAAATLGSNDSVKIAGDSLEGVEMILPELTIAVASSS